MPILSRGETAAVLTFGMIVGGAICLVPMGAGPVLATDWGALRPLVWVTLAYLAIGSGIVSFLLLQHASLRLPAAKVMATEPATIQLRYLQTLSEVANSKGSTIVFPFPVELTDLLKRHNACQPSGMRWRSVSSRRLPQRWSAWG